ncbi:MAG: polysaccharide deacetylase family protein [Deltaproteobacteria bacterium]|nr:polysaccharide deacetylase family protein [Deltaproteobacteria bacterium]
MTSTPPFAVFSCDLDTIDRHLQGYGIEDLPACDRIYRTAVPRLLDLLKELGVPGVFFFIARDANSEAPLLRQMVAAGHEVASHSMTHPQPFRTLGDAALAEEVDVSRTRLSAASGAEVIGFRAPGWDVDDRVLARIAAAGYRYDASIFPTPVLIASRLSAYRRSANKGSIFSMDLIGHAFATAVPHRLGAATNGFVEFPISVTRWLRLPVYHTFQYFVPPRLFARGVRALLRSGRPVCYEFHAADLLDLAGDDIDPRMDRHPGMRLPLEQKRAMLRDTLATITRERRVVTYRQALEERLAA